MDVKDFVSYETAQKLKASGFFESALSAGIDAVLNMINNKTD